MANGGLAVIGPGAIGTWLAWRLSAAAPVQLVGRRRAWLAQARRGIAVRTARRAALARPPRVTPTLSGSGRPDAVFICVKSADTQEALRCARALAGPATPVVSLQNGVGHVGPTLRALGAQRAVFGACYAAVLREGSARILHQAGQTVWLGATPYNRAAVGAARRWLLAARLQAPPPARQDRVLWTKLVFNAATNPVGALTARPNGELAAIPALWETTAAALREGERAARADGHAPLRRDLATLVRRACAASPRQENSMLQDLRAGRRTEIDAIVGPLLAAARRHGQRAPVLESLYRFVRRLERELAAGVAPASA